MAAKSSNIGYKTAATLAAAMATRPHSKKWC